MDTSPVAVNFKDNVYPYFYHLYISLPEVKELQSRLTGLVGEKTDAVSLKTQVEKQYNILTAQLKAKVRMTQCLSFCSLINTNEKYLLL